MAFTDFESVSQTFKKTNIHNMERTSRWSPLNIISANFSILVAPLRELWSAASCRRSQPYRSRTFGGIHRTESWHQPVGLQQTRLKSHIYTYLTNCSRSFTKKHFFKHPRQHRVSANEHDKPSKDIKEHSKISGDIIGHICKWKIHCTHIRNIFQNWLYLGFLHASHVSRSCILLHEVAWSWAVMPALIPTFWVVPSPDFAASLISIVSGMAQKS